MSKQTYFLTWYFSEERNEAGKDQGGFGAKWDGGKNGGRDPQGGDGGGGAVRGGGDGVGLLLQAPVTDMKAPPLRWMWNICFDLDFEVQGKRSNKANIGQKCV